MTIQNHSEDGLCIVIIGASGDLASKKTFPSLFKLMYQGFLPSGTQYVGYARSMMEPPAFQQRCSQYFSKNAPEDKKKAFLSNLSYVQGHYDSATDFQRLVDHLKQLEETNHFKKRNRIFYLAIPPTLFVETCKSIKATAGQRDSEEDGWVRIVVEKPFGRDTESSRLLSEELHALFAERQLYRIDHYLGKEMVQNLVVMRFANHVFSSIWSREHISNVQITFKENIGTEGRGGYFDAFGIIRDVIQNHLTQVLSLVAMERPRSLDAEMIRDGKVDLLRSVLPARPDDCVIGQYTASADGKEPGYLDDPTVPKGSKCPTFASLMLRIHNDRWDGVPFILKAGKALNDRQVVIRIQFRDEIIPFGSLALRNELVIRAQPREAVYLKFMVKEPGLSSGVRQTELDLTYSDRYSATELPDAYESLIREVVMGNSINFVRSDELEAAWKIYTPLLNAIDAGEVPLHPYVFGTRGPKAADAMALQHGFVRSSTYTWSKY